MNECLKLHKLSNMCEKRRLLRPFSGLFRHMGQLLFACHIGTRASIGENCIFQHNGLGVVISDYAVIGRNCMIYQHVTIGVLKDGDTAAPIIEDGVDIGAGAVLLGGITIHQDAKVGYILPCYDTLRLAAVIDDAMKLDFPRFNAGICTIEEELSDLAVQWGFKPFIDTRKK